MALCLIMMMCRAGALIGVNLIGKFAFDSCEPMFILFAMLVFSELPDQRYSI